MFISFIKVYVIRIDIEMWDLSRMGVRVTEAVGVRVTELLLMHFGKPPLFRNYC